MLVRMEIKCHKLARIMFYCVMTFLIIVQGNSIQAQGSENLIPVKFYSFPAGALVFLDGVLIGITPLEAQVEPREYTVKFSMPGFADWEDEFVIHIQTSFSVSLYSNEELTGIRAEDTSVEWDNRTNRIRLVPYTRESDFAIVTYNVESGTIENNALPLQWLQDTDMRQVLGIADPDRDSISAIAYESPSGRYIVYVSQNEDPALPYDTLTIYDKELDITLQTGVFLPPYATPMTPEYRLRWSPNEQFVYVKRSTVTADCQFVSLKTTTSTTECITGLLDDNGNAYGVRRFLGNPNDKGQILAILYSSDDLRNQLWLIDLADVSGSSLGFENVLDAAFSPNNANIVYVADGDGLVRYDLVSGERMLIDSLIGKLPVLEVSLAPTLEYALIRIGDEMMNSYWIYRLPPMN